MDEVEDAFARDTNTQDKHIISPQRKRVAVAFMSRKEEIKMLSTSNINVKC